MPSPTNKGGKATKYIKQLEAYRDKVSRKIENFLSCIDYAKAELCSDPKIMTSCIKMLNRVRNSGGKSGNGIILLDQYFKVPQIGEVIRDIWVLQSFSDVINQQQQQLNNEKLNSPSNERVHTIPEESQSIIEQMRQNDPAIVESLKLLQNTKLENKLAILFGRASKIQTKYNSLVAQMGTKGVDFIIATTGKSSVKQFNSSLLNSKHKPKPQQGFYSSVDITNPH